MEKVPNLNRFPFNRCAEFYIKIVYKWSDTSTASYAFMAVYRVNFTFTANFHQQIYTAHYKAYFYI
jgi:hypothetical protein